VNRQIKFILSYNETLAGLVTLVMVVTSCQVGKKNILARTATSRHQPKCPIGQPSLAISYSPYRVCHAVPGSRRPALLRAVGVRGKLTRSEGRGNVPKRNAILALRKVRERTNLCSILSSSAGPEASG
jgi:hypothetical protein